MHLVSQIDEVCRYFSEIAKGNNKTIKFPIEEPSYSGFV
jgi:hypothetical protein